MEGGVARRRSIIANFRVAEHPRAILERLELAPYASTGSFAILTWPLL